MHSITPFIGQVSTQEQDEWIKVINTHSKNCKLAPIGQLSENEKQHAEMAVVANPDPTQLTLLPKLKWVQSLWAGVETIFAADIDPNIQVVRLTDPQLAESMAEATLAWSLYLHRNMPQYRAQQNQSMWAPLPLELPQNTNISVFGLGKLGSLAATRLQQNGFTVKGWSKSKKTIDHVETFHGNAGLTEILPHTNIAIILLPHTPHTENLFDEELLNQLPKGASIINFARGSIVVEQDLLKALDNEHLEHAVLDVFIQEPLATDHVFWSHKNVTVLPHISAPTTVATAAVIAADNIDLYMENGTIPQAADRALGY